MARSTPAIATFSAGEVTPFLEGRTDHAVYFKSCRSLQNMISTVHGPATRRPGTRHVAEVKSSANRTVQKRFVFGNPSVGIVQAYLIEIGDRYFRFYKDEGQITVANTDGAISNGGFPSVTDWDDIDGGSGVSAHDAGNNRLSLTPGGTASTDIAAREQDVAITSGINVQHSVQVQVISNSPADFIKCRVGSSSAGTQYVNDRKLGVGYHLVSFTPTASPFYFGVRNQGSENNQFVSLNKNIQVDNVVLLDNQALELVTPYLQADLFDSNGVLRLKFHQSLDVLYIQHPDYPEYKLKRYGHADWSLEKVANESGPLLDEVVDTTTMTPGAATGAGVTLTASNTTKINGGLGFQTTDVGRIVRTKEGSVYGWGYIVGWTSTTVVTIDIMATLTDTTAKETWALGLHSDTDGWPRAGKFSQQRRVVGGAAARAQRLDGSEVGDLETFTPGTDDANPFALELDSDQANPILWLAPLKKLIAGTAGDLFRVTGDTDRAPITPVNANAEDEGAFGAADVEPEKAGTALLYVQRQMKNILELGYAIDVDGFKSTDMSLLAEHLTETYGIIRIAWQAKPFGVLWCVRSDGLLLGFTNHADEQSRGWHRHILGGSFTGSSWPVVESVEVVPTSGNDQLWLVVKRTVNGSTVRYVEFMEEPPSAATAFAEQWFVDSGLAYSGAAVTTITGLSHLEGESVQVLSANGAETKTVTGGQITGLSSAVTAAIVGLGSTWKLTPQRLETGTPVGVSTGKPQKISAVTIRTLRTAGLEYSADDSTYYGATGTDVGTGITSAAYVAGSTRDVPFNPFPGIVDKDADIYFKGSLPFNATILSILPTFSVNP